MKNNRIDTDKLFTKIINSTNSNNNFFNNKNYYNYKKNENEKKEKKHQVSIYLTKKQDKELSIQGALKEKEPDKSAIARAGIDIILELSNEEYAAMKFAAKYKGITTGQIVKEALAKYL